MGQDDEAAAHTRISCEQIKGVLQAGRKGSRQENAKLWRFDMIQCGEAPHPITARTSRNRGRQPSHAAPHQLRTGTSPRRSSDETDRVKKLFENVFPAQAAAKGQSHPLSGQVASRVDAPLRFARDKVTVRFVSFF